MTDQARSAEEGTLLFIYAADSGLFNTVADIAHKMFSPQTYECSLCALTHGYFKVRESWQAFVAQLPVPCLFLHRDQVMAWPGIDPAALPAVYRMRSGHWQPCLDRQAIARCPDLQALQAAVRDACLCAPRATP